MTKIGLISDTHGYLDDAVFTHFADCDEIWHAGDFGGNVADRLAAFKPLKGVYGNIDGTGIRKDFPLNLRFKCEDVDVWMTHIGGYPGRYNAAVKPEIYTNPPQLFITGHSHILKVIFDEKIKCLHLNPGAAGKQGWHKVQTLMRFEIDGKQIKNLQVIELAHKGAPIKNN
ncbi:metallophosphoesterase family protein [Mucilaginibacter koreensis]